MEKKEGNVEVLENNESDYIEKAKGIYSSIRDHLTPEFRKQYNMRRFVGCVLVFLILRYMQSTSDYKLVSTASILPFVWSFTAWLFWHYSFWHFQGGFIDTFSRNLIHFGSIWSLIGRAILQNIIILVWIALIAPVSGIKTWRKAIKLNKTIFVENNQSDGWR